MDQFACLPQKEKQPYFEIASNKKGLPYQIIEKDFWVCWTLKQLFSIDKLSDHLIFKGGTSLSKAYHLIERFSEDIDISINKFFFGYIDELEPEKAKSNKKQLQLIKKLSSDCRNFVQTKLKSHLSERFSTILGNANTSWSIDIDPNDPDGQSLIFFYPTNALTTQNNYIHPTVKVEVGARGGSEPCSQVSITPFIEEVIPETLANPNIKITTLAAERTFWEKATILHMFCHWPEGKKLPERQSRHFFDFYKLLQSEIKTKACNDPNLLTQVAGHKKIYFRAGWAAYEDAIQGSLKLLPNQTILKIFKNDYKQMKDIFYGKPVAWEAIIVNIAEFEREFNSGKL